MARLSGRSWFAADPRNTQFGIKGNNAAQSARNVILCSTAGLTIAFPSHHKEQRTSVPVLNFHLQEYFSYVGRYCDFTYFKAT